MSQKKEWKLVRGTWISTMPVLPGVWRRKEGGHVVRARAKDGATGQLKEIVKSLPDADAATALKWLEDERARIRAGVQSVAHRKTRFAEFAASLFEHKVKVGEIRSAKGRQKWADTLKHLIAGTSGRLAKKQVTGFGEIFLDRLHASHVDAWKRELGELIAAGDYAPTTVNGWLAILRVILKAAKRQLELPQLATDGFGDFDTSEHVTYCEEEPNALLPHEVAPFLERLRELHPAHFGMVYLGLVTGLRPSSLRAIRRRGAEADIDWERGRLFVRRSHSLGKEVMRTTKQRRRYAIDLPVEVVKILQWHVDTQLSTPEQRESDLLFPSITGGFRSPTVLNKPLAEVASDLELGKKISQRALRRTFNDLARAAQVGDLVTRSISGHLTERMQHHYSTVSGVEQRDALGKVLRIVTTLPTSAGGEDAPPRGRATPAGGEVGGEESPGGGEETKKAG